MQFRVDFPERDILGDAVGLAGLAADIDEDAAHEGSPGVVVAGASISATRAIVHDLSTG
jgi:hypothetical protein